MADNNFDVVIVGSGAGGLSAAIRATDLGLRAVILEAHHKIGGSTAFSGGQVWAGKNHLMVRDGIADTFAETKAYVKSLNKDPSVLDETLLDQWVTESPRVLEDLEHRGAIKWSIIHDFPDYYYPVNVGSKPEGRYLSGAPMLGETLGDLRGKLLYSMHHPPGLTYDELYATHGEEAVALADKRREEDVLTMGTGIAAHLLRAVQQRGVPIMTGHRGKKLLNRNGAVVGIECESSNGLVTFHGPVILATGGYDWSPDLVEKHSSLQQEEYASVAPRGIRGDGLRLAGEMGARIIQMPLDQAVHLPGYRVSDPVPETDDSGIRYALQTALPHSMMVDATSRRFADDSYYQAICAALVHGRGKKPFFYIWDEHRHQQYGFDPTPAGAPYPEKMGVESAPTIPLLAAKLGLDGDTLVATVERFNLFAKDGEDPDFKRGKNEWVCKFLGDPLHKPSPVLGPIEQGPFFGMKMKILNMGIGAAGIHVGMDGRVLHTNGSPIPGLYGVGVVSAPTMTGSGYNSGFSIGRAIVYGYLAVEEIKRTTSGSSHL
jgi:3-oxosteroid 1-dehydrogenase